MRKYILLLVFIAVSLPVISQDLAVQQIFTRTDVCPASESEACVTVIAHESLELIFTSNVDPRLNLVSRKQNAQNMEYTFLFPTDKLEYFDRVLTIHCPKIAAKATISLLLGPNESEFYQISITECYNIYYERGLTLFSKCSYVDAKEAFKKALNCTDIPSDNEVKNQILIIDSIFNLKKLAKESYEMLDYRKAEEYYRIIYALNKEDNVAYQKYIECRNENNRYCEMYTTHSLNYYLEHEYEKSQILYKRASESGCSIDHELVKFYSGTQEKKKGKQENPIKKTRKLETVITYQYSVRAPFGISIGGFKDKKVSAFFTLLFSNPAKLNYFELDGAIGLSARPVKNKYTPIWLTLGVGYTGLNLNVKEGEKEIKGLFHAASPEIGILVKIPFGKEPKAGLAIRYNFQYRFALFNEHIKPFNHAIGLGFCF